MGFMSTWRLICPPTVELSIDGKEEPLYCDLDCSLKRTRSHHQFLPDLLPLYFILISGYSKCRKALFGLHDGSC